MTKTTRSKERDHHLPHKSAYRGDKKSGEGAHGFGSVEKEIEFEKDEFQAGRSAPEAKNTTEHVKASKIFFD